MKPLDHSQCDPAECIHRAALDTAPQVQGLAEDIARSRQEKEQYLRKHPVEARAEQEFAEEEYYEAKRRARLHGPEAQGMAEVRQVPGATTFGGGTFHGTYGGVPVVSYDDRVAERRLRVESLEAALLEARAEQAAHGDPMPLQDVRNAVGDALRLLESKNEAYGDAWRSQGFMGNLARLRSKVDRMSNLLWRDADDTVMPPHDGETVVDTALDLINLAAMFAVNWTEGNKWGNRVD